MNTLKITVERPGAGGIRPYLEIEIPWPTDKRLPDILLLPGDAYAVKRGKYASGEEKYCYILADTWVSVPPSNIKPAAA
jgi:hypothetical protein